MVINSPSVSLVSSHSLNEMRISSIYILIVIEKSLKSVSEEGLKKNAHRRWKKLVLIRDQKQEYVSK